MPHDSIMKFESLSDAINFLRCAGFSLRVKPGEDDVIRAKGPTDLITPELVAAIRPFRQDLLWVLRGQRDWIGHGPEDVAVDQRRNIIV